MNNSRTGNMRHHCFSLLCGFLHLIFPTLSIGENRLITLAPNLTEIVFGLGAGEQLVGVSKYSLYPVEAQALPQLGSMFDSNVEQILSLNPTLVLLLNEQSHTEELLKRAQKKTLTVKHERVEDILQSILLIGENIEKQKEAESLVRAMRRSIEKASKARIHATPLRTLVVVGALATELGPKQINVACRETLYDDLLNALKVKNVCEEKTGYPMLSAESIASLDPEVIFHLSADSTQPALKESIAKSWSQFKYITAVRKNKVFIISEDFAVSPGPRLIQTLELFSKLLMEHHEQ